jgi:hypothetical protein
MVDPADIGNFIGFGAAKEGVGFMEGGLLGAVVLYM